MFQQAKLFDPSARILVVGDIILDAYASGDVERISPEAPVPIMRHLHHHEVPGGSANVAMNIVALGGKACLIGLIGKDEEGARLANLLSASGIDNRMVEVEDRPTTFKLRILAGKHQMLRVDKEVSAPAEADAERKIINTALAEMCTADAMILSDYQKGCLTENVIQELIRSAKQKDIPVFVDPKRTDFAAYKGADYITPNRAELKAATGIACSDKEKCRMAATQVMRECGASILLTLSEQGMVLFQEKGEEEWLPTEAKEVFDVSGAGDSVIAAFAYACASGMPLSRALRVANVTAGVVIAKAGTATASEEEVSKALDPTHGGQESEVRLMSWQEAAELRANWKREGLSVGFTNGCFDLVHPGHVKLLNKAAGTCDRLVVALNSDSSVRRLKGESRPIQSQEARAIVMAAMRFVDAVVLFEEDTPLEIIQVLAPDVLIKGSDYEEADIVGADFVKSTGGKVERIDFEAGQSTSRLVSRSKG